MVAARLFASSGARVTRPLSVVKLAPGPPSLGFSTTAASLTPSSNTSKSSVRSGSSSSSSSSSSSTWKAPAPGSGSTAAYRRQSRREWLLVGVAGSAAVVGTWYYWFNIRPRHQANKLAAASAGNKAQFSLTAESRASFYVQAGGSTNKVVTTLTNAEVDRRLKEKERSTPVDYPADACIVSRYDTNSVASNDPIEDARSEVIVERDRGIIDNLPASTGSPVSTETPSQQLAKGYLCFFAVMDGHAGPHTSALLENKLDAFVALELDKVFREAGEYHDIAKAKAAMPSKLWRAIFGGPAQAVAGSTSGLDGDPEVVKRAIAKAFRQFDKEIVNTPVELLKEYELSRASISSSSAQSNGADSAKGSSDAGSTVSLSSLANTIFPSSSNASFTTTQKNAYESLLPAMSGSCALLTYIDSARQDVYVACTGDSRAVAGYWDQEKGRWEAEALSVDQMGRNQDEVKRIQSEHPASEHESVIQRGRVLGGLEPTRAFGDARYKWDRELQGRLYDAFLPGGRKSTRGPPRGLETPPYVTATPEVQWRRVGETSSNPKRELRFIIMATDGLWDMMSNEEAVSLVAGQLAGVKGTVLSSSLAQSMFQPADKQQAASANAVEQASPEAQKQLADSKTHPLSKGLDSLRAFQFQDDNMATHLIRNAFGGANQQRVAGLLAIPAPESRRYRDDVTVNVILFNSPTSSTPPNSSQPDIKAKL